MISESIEFSTSEPVPYKVYITQDKSFVEKYANEILSLVSASYANGNKSVRTTRDVLGANMAKFVFNAIGQIIALSLYRSDLGGFKRFCSASRKEDPKYKGAVQEIIKSDIEPYDNWFWVEASGPIEHYFKKHGGNPIPNYLAHKFLRKPKKDIVELDEDGAHYKRFLFSDSAEPTKKMIFGFKSREAADLVMQKINDYQKFKLDVDSAVEDLFEGEEVSAADKSLEAASIVIQEIEERYESGCNEMLPAWKDALDGAVARFKEEQCRTGLDDGTRLYVDSNLATAERLLQEMPLLVVRQFRFAG